MGQLPPEWRDNVIYIDSRRPERAYSNRAKTNNLELSHERWVHKEGNVYVNEVGETIPGPGDGGIATRAGECSSGPGTGAFRRISSNPGSGRPIISPTLYTYASARVFLTNNLNYDPTFEMPYIMMGGWGGGAGNPAIDAGFAHQDGIWWPFMKGTGDNEWHSWENLPYRPGQTVTLSFVVASNGILQLWIRGSVVRYGVVHLNCHSTLHNLGRRMCRLPARRRKVGC